MQHISSVVRTQSTTSKTQAGRIGPDDLKLVNYVYARLETIFGRSKYNSYFPTAESLKNSKREYAKHILKFSYDELKTGLDEVPDSQIKWPDLLEILKLCKPARRDPIHQDYQLPPPCNIDREEGKKRSAALMQMMKGAN